MERQGPPWLDHRRQTSRIYTTDRMERGTEYAKKAGEDPHVVRARIDAVQGYAIGATHIQAYMQKSEHSRCVNTVAIL